MAEHAFVAMPYGLKEGINFNEVYTELIKPALESAGFEVFRADEELRAGNIRTDMFQELLLADLVVADLSIDNPNVWYELGVRHALRARGVLQIQGKRDYLPFDVYVDRALKYHIKDGVPDPAYLSSDKEALARFATETMGAWRGRTVSPVYHLLPFLQQPEWKHLRVGGVNEIWDKQEEWEQRIDIALKKGKPGDILVFADEVPTRFLCMEAYRASGNALFKLKQFEFARQQYDKALEMDPKDLESRQKKGIAIGRLGKYSEARVWLESLIKDHPDDAENWALLGRVAKDTWTASWRRPDSTPEQMKGRAANETGLLDEAIRAYLTGFRKDPRSYFAGINALTLLCLRKHLAGDSGRSQERKALEGGVRWAVQCSLEGKPNDYWCRVTFGDLELLSSRTASLEAAYKSAAALAVSNGDWFGLDSSLQQLRLLQDLGFAPEAVEKAIQIFLQSINLLREPQSWIPRRVFLFSGHMMDRPERQTPRFPEGKENIAAEAIAHKLDELGAGPNDLALCGGANGGDTLFAEACLNRGLRLEVHIPFDEPRFLRESVRFDGSPSFPGESWQKRYFQIKGHSNTCMLIMHEELGAAPKGVDSFARNNLWQLYTALSWGPEKVHFLSLWNRKEGDGPGGTNRMVNTVQKCSGQAHILDTNALW